VPRKEGAKQEPTLNTFADWHSFSGVFSFRRATLRVL
jgi:hypothetical protein